MKKFKMKLKMLVYGFPSLTEEYTNENFKLKTEVIDLLEIETQMTNNIFVPSYFIASCAFQIEGEEEQKCNYFETINDIEFEISNDKAKSVKTIGKSAFEIADKIITSFTKKMRLIFNIRIIFPISLVSIYDMENNEITKMIRTKDFPSVMGLNENFDSELFNQNSRTGFNLEKFEETEKNNIRFARAIELFNNSFEPTDKSMRFLLLFSSLEALFVTSKQNITERIATCTSRILAYKTEEETLAMYNRMKELYNFRSKYIHGQKTKNITLELEKELRNIVRWVMLIYWNLCLKEKGPRVIINELKENVKLPLDTRMYAIYLKSSDYSEAQKEAYTEVAIELANGRARITEEENGIIKKVEF